MFSDFCCKFFTPKLFVCCKCDTVVYKHVIKVLTVSGHAHGQTLLEATVLAAVPVHSHDQTVLVRHTHLVADVLLDAASEETLRRENATCVREHNKKHGNNTSTSKLLQHHS